MCIFNILHWITLSISSVAKEKHKKTNKYRSAHITLPLLATRLETLLTWCLRQSYIRTSPLHNHIPGAGAFQKQSAIFGIKRCQRVALPWLKKRDTCKLCLGSLWFRLYLLRFTVQSVHLNFVLGQLNIFNSFHNELFYFIIVFALCY